ISKEQGFLAGATPKERVFFVGRRESNHRIETTSSTSSEEESAKRCLMVRSDNNGNSDSHEDNDEDIPTPHPLRMTYPLMKFYIMLMLSYMRN
ncbi:hypothetical protein Lal_00044192, partial [Lupinus albus]